MRRLVQKFLPKQADIDKILKIIQWNILKGTHLPMMIKGIQAGYLNSSILKIYTYIKPKINYPVLNQLYKR